jgi:CRISPR/Cas system-associated exonuclease Cas4 (RecB family)
VFGKRKVVPVELKTGIREHVSHKNQTMIYALLMAERYKGTVEDSLGILVYLELGKNVKFYYF